MAPPGPRGKSRGRTEKNRDREAKTGKCGREPGAGAKTGETRGKNRGDAREPGNHARELNESRVDRERRFWLFFLRKKKAEK